MSKIRLILLMVYTCNVKGLKDVEELGSNQWWVITADYTSKFKAI